MEENRETRLYRLLKDFDQKIDKYGDFEKCIVTLVTQLVKGLDVQVHNVTSRKKERDSFKKKIRKPGKEYTELADMTDIVGLRVTTYFEKDVDEIKKLIEKEFDIDEENSVDKRKLHDPDRFGYMSLHYVVSLKNNRIKLPEYSTFSGMKTEIQIRSILQHTWAEIEHDLGYKSKYSIPKDIKRRFSQLASLLELADREFLQIRNKIGVYGDYVLECLKKGNNSILVDKNSMIVIFSYNKKIKNLDKDICTITSAELTSNDDFSETVSSMLLWVGIESVNDLTNFIDAKEKEILKFANNWIKQKDYREFNYGISVMYMCYMILAERNEEDEINEFAKDFELGKHVDNFGDILLSTYNSTFKKTDP